MNTKVYNDVMNFTMSKYSMILSYSEEDHSYIVSVPELPGCMADGETPEQAVKNAEIIIHEWIECAIEDGEEIPKPQLFNNVTASIQKVQYLKNKKSGLFSNDITEKTAFLQSTFKLTYSSRSGQTLP